MSFQKYKEYKPSGVRWIDEIPSTWRVSKLKWHSRVSSGIDSPSIDGNYPLMGANGVIGTSDTYSLNNDTILMGRVGSAGLINYVTEKAGVSDNALIFSNFSTLNTKYFYYFLVADNFELDVSKTAQPLITASRVKEHFLCVPDLLEQKKISDFLDCETAKIDELIKKQEKLVEELNLKKFSEISYAVTNGLNKSVEFSSCDNPWINKIPKHWAFKKLKHIVKIFASNVDKKSVDGQKSIQLCNYTDVYYNEEITSKLDFMYATATDEQIEKFSLKANDVIITKDSETPDDIGISALVPKDIPGVICGYHLSMVRPKSHICGAFIKRLFDSSYVKSSWMTLANGVTRYGLGQYSIDNLKVPVPPYEEQLRIAEYLDELTKNIDNLIDKANESIRLLKEHRITLIRAAVTGKIDVRELA